jgi:hypothetical protein
MPSPRGSRDWFTGGRFSFHCFFSWRFPVFSRIELVTKETRCAGAPPTSRNDFKRRHLGHNRPSSDRPATRSARGRAPTLCQQSLAPAPYSVQSRVKTQASAARVEYLRGIARRESQIMLRHTARYPCWRIVFSTFRRCMSFYTARVRSVEFGMSALGLLSLR